MKWIREVLRRAELVRYEWQLQRGITQLNAAILQQRTAMMRGVVTEAREAGLSG